MLNALYHGATIGCFFLGIFLPYKAYKFAVDYIRSLNQPVKNYSVTYRDRGNVDTKRIGE